MRLMIKWKLNSVMAEKRKTGQWLAEQLHVHPNTIYRLKKTDRMPSLTEELLSGLCKSLECKPCDLLEYAPLTEDE
ncbi:MAG: helix-turn-helix domain-containing protein [Leptolyngbyaceae cyanobacterium SL_7_1]|nr:helix-turn-helix domain-containing protein [Leptolyngbyaceae cyanobacterium SL_7_1]